MENILIQKIPLNPPLPKGEDARKDSLRVMAFTPIESPVIQTGFTVFFNNQVPLNGRSNFAAL
jgi:hypothetical protein